MDKLPIAIVYATWSGLGSFYNSYTWLFLLQTDFSLASNNLGLFLIVIGVILVNSFAGKIN